MDNVGSQIAASHPHYERLIEDTLRRAKHLGDDGPATYLAHVILDYPLTWALTRLGRLDSVLRARTRGRHAGHAPHLPPE